MAGGWLAQSFELDGALSKEMKKGPYYYSLEL